MSRFCFPVFYSVEGGNLFSFFFFTTLILAESRWWTRSWQQLRGQSVTGQPRKRKKRLRHLGAKRTRQGWRMKRAGCPLYPSPVLFPSRRLGTFQPTTKMPPKIKRIGINSLRTSKKKKIPPASGKRFDLHQLALCLNVNQCWLNATQY